MKINAGDAFFAIIGRRRWSHRDAVIFCQPEILFVVFCPLFSRSVGSFIVGAVIEVKMR